MKFFKPPFTKDHIEEQYKKLSQKLHPDKGGSKEDFNKMVDEKILILEVIRQSANENERPKIKMRKRPAVILRNNFDVDKAIRFLKEIKKIIK